MNEGLIMRNRDAFLRDIVIEHPLAIGVLEDLHLDYCCRGARSLAEACREHGLDPERVLRSIEALEALEAHNDGAAHAATLESTEALIGHIVRVHHTFARNSIATLQPLMAKVLSVHGAEHPELEEVAHAFDALRVDIEPHLLKEETILFPALCAAERNEQPRLPFPLSHPIERMRAEHDGVNALLRTIATLTRDHQPPADACTSWRALYRGLADLERDLHMHIHLENNVLFARQP